MGMLIDGKWEDAIDHFMQDGVFQREASALDANVDAQTLEFIKSDPSRFVLVASKSCP